MKKLLLILALIPNVLFAAEFVAGVDYQVISKNAVVAKGKARVTEFFSYGCPACYRLEPTLEAWLKKKKNSIDFERVPVVFHKGWDVYAKAYYTLTAVNLSEKVSPLLFKAIQEDNKDLANDKAMVKFLVAQGVDKELAQSAFESSPTIDSMVKEGMRKMQSYKVFAIPTVVVNGKYRTDLQMAKVSPQRLTAIIDYLITKK